MVVKLLKSIKVCVQDGENPDALLRGLREDKENSVLTKISDEGIMPHLYDILEVTPEQATMVRGYTASQPENLSWTTRSRLGSIFIVEDKQERMIAKLRLTEQHNPNDQREWNVGIVSQDPSRGRIKPEEKYRHFPGQIYPAKFNLLTGIRFNKLSTIAAECGVDILDLKPQYHHLYRAEMRLGAHFDEDHPQCHEDRQRMELFDEQLDAMSITGLRKQSWAVHEGKVIDPETGQPGLKWVSPRIILEVKG